MRSDDGAGLERFVAAQAPVWETVMAELRAGRKRTHWMWFVFPQLAGLGRSEMAHRFALTGLAEARAYLAHPVLGPRLRAAAEALLAWRALPPEAVLGEIDALKLQASATLFARAAPEEAVFAELLTAFFDGAEHPGTLARLAAR